MAVQGDKTVDISRIEADGFDLDIQQPSSRTEIPGAMMRDAVAAGPLMLGTRFVPPPPGLLPAFGPAAPAAPKPSAGEAWAKKQGMFQDLLARPAAFMARRTNLASPKKLQGFLSDRARVQRYLTHPLIKAVLSSPALTKTLMRTPGVVPAFLASPAMQDRRSAKMLFDSGLVRMVLDAPGPSALMKDAEFVQSVVSDPATVQWMTRNPEAAANIFRLAPLLGR
jgi:hypothetical protein